jgi:hypothetical protein
MPDNQNHKKENGNCNKGRISRGFEVSRRIKFHNHSQRLSQKEEVGRTRGGSRNVAATEYLRGYEKSDIQEQEERLFEYARISNCWFDLKAIEQEFGSEIFEKLNEEYGAKAPAPGAEACIYQYDEQHFLKVMRYNAFDTRPLGFLDNRIALHNHLFPGTFYELIGFCRGKYGKFCFVLKQPYIKGTEPTETEIYNEMTKRGFSQDYFEYTTYISDHYIIKDLHTGNFIKNENGLLYCIDPVPSLNFINRTYNNI